MRRVVTFFNHFIHQFQRAGNYGAASLLRVEELLFVHFLRLGMVTDVHHVDVFIGSAQEQIEQNIETFGHVFGGLVHRAGNVHQAEHHRLAGGLGPPFIVLVT
ncbi:hypothetical protein D3C78_1669840 [compost metagenome]